MCEPDADTGIQSSLMTDMRGHMTDDDYRTQLDAEAVQRARSKKSWPDPAKVRRVAIYDGPARTLPKQMAHQRITEEDENV